MSATSALDMDDPSLDRASSDSLHTASDSEDDRSFSSLSHSVRHNSRDSGSSRNDADAHSEESGNTSDESGTSDFSIGSSASSLTGDSSKDDCASGSPNSQSISRLQMRRKIRQKKFVRKGQEGRQAEKDAFRVGAVEDYYYQQKSYFHYENGERGHFSLRHEWRCFWAYARHLWASIEEDRLPWKSDFFALEKMRWPRNKKEALSRLNLNIPYYAANYLEVFYAVSLPFLFVYNLPFFLFLVVTCVTIHSVSMRRKELLHYDTHITIVGYRFSYHLLGHVLLLTQGVLFMFFNGLKTVALVLLLNAAIIIPHALWRRTTFFDDEEMEKCRPRIGQYALTVLFLILCYLEGAADREQGGGRVDQVKASPEVKKAAGGKSTRDGGTAEHEGDSATPDAIDAVDEEFISQVIAVVAGNTGDTGGSPTSARRGSLCSSGAAGMSTASFLSSSAVVRAAAQAAKEEAGVSRLLGAIEREKLRRPSTV